MCRYVCTKRRIKKVYIVSFVHEKTVLRTVVASSSLPVNIFINAAGDKGISLGDNSQVKASEIKIQNVKIGIASKDSSDVLVNKSNMRNVRVCFAAYKKKQEFNGAKLQINEQPDGCPKTNFIDQHSTIIFN